MKSSVKSTNKYDKAQIDMGFKKVHIWVPLDKVDEIKWQAKLLRDTHKKEAQQEIQRIKNEKEQLVIDADYAEKKRLADAKSAELRRISDIEELTHYARASEIARQVAEQKAEL